MQRSEITINNVLMDKNGKLRTYFIVVSKSKTEKDIFGNVVIEIRVRKFEESNMEALDKNFVYLKIDSKDIPHLMDIQDYEKLSSDERMILSGL